MIDFSQFDSLIAMTMYFNNEAVCRNAIVELVGELEKKKTSFALIAVSTIVLTVRMVSFAAITASGTLLVRWVLSLKTVISHL